MNTFYSIKKFLILYNFNIFKPKWESMQQHF